MALILATLLELCLEDRLQIRLVARTGTFVTTVLSTDASYAQATFSISATNSSGNVIDVTAANLDAGSSVTIDTAKPIITLVGNPPYTALQGESYTDPSTTVSDLDNPSYSEITTITKNLDTSILGAQNITYSAPPDAAGNIPDPVNRIVTVLAKPLGIDTLDNYKHQFRKLLVCNNW